MPEIKLTKVERDQDQALENFIHRMVFSGVCTYDQAFECLDARQCLNMRQAKMKFDTSKKK